MAQSKSRMGEYTGRTSVKAVYGRRRDVVDPKMINPIDLIEEKAIGIVLPFGNNSTTDSGYSKDGTSSSGISGGTKPGIDGSTLFRSSYLTKDQVISNVRNLILTNKGERIMNPDFGTNIYNLLFEQNVRDLDETIYDEIQDAFDKYMPLCRIENLEVNQSENKINIVLGFSVREYDINEILEITTGVA